MKLNLVRKPKPSESKLIKHIACDACGSSDANGLYDDDHTYCFSCHTYAHGQDVAPRVAVPQRKTQMLDIKGTIKAIPDRGITQQTCEKYGVTQENGQHFYPYTDDAGGVVAAKLRRVADKTFSILGTFTNARLFGQQLFHAGGKAVTITEGELDALAAFQMNGSLYPVVSVRNGAQAALKDCKAQYEWLNSFDSIVICFDADEPGKKASKEVAELFGNKAKIVKHLSGYKDACDYLIAGATVEDENAGTGSCLVARGQEVYTDGLPFNPPSSVLYNLLGWLTDAAKGVVKTSEGRIADAGNNAPVGTTQALIEQGSKVFSSIHARLHRSQAKSLQVLSRINCWYLEDMDNQSGAEIAIEDFEDN